MRPSKKQNRAIGMTELSSRKRQRGVTLMELLTVVTIVAIIASVSYPSYTQFILRAKRSAGASMLLQMADRQQQFFMDNKQYAANMTNLGYASASISINDEGKVISASDTESIYTIGLTNTSATAYTLTATALHRQAAKDTKCGNLTLTNTGERGQSGSGENCW